MNFDMNSMFDHMKDEAIKECNNGTHVITDLGHKKIKDLTDELHDDLPIFERAGYSLHSLEVELGVSPKLIPHFRVHKQISKEEQQAILDEVKHKRLISLLLSSLFKSSYLKEVLRIGDLDFHGLKIELAAIPKVHLLFWKEGEETAGDSHDEDLED